MFITTDEIINLEFNRDVDSYIIKKNWVTDSENDYIRGYIGGLYSDIVDDLSGYSNFIEDYIKPIVSLGVLHDNFDSIILNITDKGLFQLYSEGGAVLIGNERIEKTKNSHYYKLMRRINYMVTEAQRLKDKGDEKFLNFNSTGDTRIIRYSNNKKINKIF